MSFLQSCWVLVFHIFAILVGPEFLFFPVRALPGLILLISLHGLKFASWDKSQNKAKRSICVPPIPYENHYRFNYDLFEATAKFMRLVLCQIFSLLESSHLIFFKPIWVGQFFFSSGTNLAWSSFFH